MKAAIDIGSNTVRMLIGDVLCERVAPQRYFRSVTRLGGDYDPMHGLSAAASQRTLCALEAFATVLKERNPTCLRVVATEAVRRAVNRQQFVGEVRARTGLSVEILAGKEEAELTFSGAFSALQPSPLAALIFDIGGGSTEFILCKAGKRLWAKSYPLGVIRLAEAPDSAHGIEGILNTLVEDLRLAGWAPLLASASCELVGTAGTVTTLAAMDLAMTEYDWQRINNHVLPQSTLQALHERLLPLAPPARELIAGVEKGRGDLILPGAEIVLALLHVLGKDQMRVSDFGLLEGVLLSM